MENSTLKNIFFVIISQLCGFMLSIFIVLFLPKILSLEGYAYWQLFMFYTIYVGVLHFGIADGLYLRLGGKHYKELDYSIIKSQIICMLVGQAVICIVIFCGMNYIVVEESRRWILHNIYFYTIASNLTTLFGFLLQAVNRIYQYARAVMINKISTLLLFVFVIFIGADSFKPFVICYLISQFITVIYYAVVAKEIFFAKALFNKYVLNELRRNIISGLTLTVSSVSGNLIIGMTRKLIDWKWGIVVFGKLSLAFSLVSFFQQMLGQIGAVFFPILRRNNSEIDLAFLKICDFLNIILPIIYILYVPISWLIRVWLPSYGESVQYLSILLPICIYDSKFSVLCATYLKVLRREKALMIANCVSMIICFAACIFMIKIQVTVIAIIFVPVIVIFLRSFSLEIYIRKYLKIVVSWKEFEIILCVLILEVLILFVDNKIVALLLCGMTYISYLTSNRNKLIYYCRIARSNLKEK